MRSAVTCLLVVLTLLCSLPAAAQNAVRVPPEVLDAIVDDELNPLPRSMTPEERLLPLPRPDLRLPLAPPPGPVTTPPEYARNEGLLIRWGSSNDLLTAMTVGITTGEPSAVVHILVETPSQQSSAAAVLTGAGAVLDRVNFILYDGDSVWMRDYGPRFIWDGTRRAMVDHTYNRSFRPRDNAFPDHLAALWGEAQYDIPLTHGGGNFHLFGTAEAFMTELILDENPSLDAADVEQLYLDYQGLDLTITDGLPSWYDGTKHIDMWLLPVSDDTVIVGQYSPTDSEAYALTEATTAELSARGYTVLRTPGWNSGGTHYTYTNAVIFNDLVFTCEFSGATAANAAALATFQNAFPGSDIIPVDCSQIIQSAGALHCIVMHVPAGPPLFADGFEGGDTGRWSATVGAE